MAVQESAFPSLLLHVDLGNKDKKRIEGQHQENENGNENDSSGKYSDTKNCAVFCPKTIGCLKRRKLQLISTWFGTVNVQFLFETP